jgi:aldehyde dehydrogenase (NAD(P)+)
VSIDGKLVFVLGAGNIAAIPPMDVLTKMFNEGKVCILKMNPVDAYLGSFIEEAFKEAIDKNYLAVVYR